MAWERLLSRKIPTTNSTASISPYISSKSLAISRSPGSKYSTACSGQRQQQGFNRTRSATADVPGFVLRSKFTPACAVEYTRLLRYKIKYLLQKAVGFKTQKTIRVQGMRYFSLPSDPTPPKLVSVVATAQILPFKNLWGSRGQQSTKIIFITNNRRKKRNATQWLWVVPSVRLQ